MILCYYNYNGENTSLNGVMLLKNIFVKTFVFVAFVFLLLSLCVSAESYDVYVCGIQITDENASDVLGEMDEGASVSYDASTSTLTLDNAHLTGFGTHFYDSNSCICYDGGLNVVLVGDNSISVIPNEDELRQFAMAFMGWQNITITSEEEATLDIDIGTSTRENFGFYIMEGGADFSGKVSVDIELADVVITDDFSYNVNATFGNSIGIHAEGDIHFHDDVSVRCKTGNIFVPEDSAFVGTTDELNSGGTSVGIATFGELLFDTTGEMYFYVGDADGKRAGIASFNNFEIRSGNVVVEMAPSKGEYLIGGPVVYFTMTDAYPCVPLCGDAEENMVTGKITEIMLAGIPLKTYTNADGSLPTYAKLVPAVIGIPEFVTNSDGNTEISVSVEDEEKTQNALVVFSAYNSFGKMIDVKFTLGSSSQDGKISTELNISDAVRVVVFVFENSTSMKPLTHQLEITDLT